MDAIFTRAEYLAAPLSEQAASHRRYYAQFVTPAVRSFVGACIGVERIRESTDKHFNDIPLHMWDALAPTMKSLCLSRMGDVLGIPRGPHRRIPWSLSDVVCIAKEAAAQIKEEA